MDEGLGGGTGVLGAPVEGAQGPCLNSLLGGPLWRLPPRQQLGSLRIRHRNSRFGKARIAPDRRFGNSGAACRCPSQGRLVRADLASVPTMAPPESIAP